MSIKKVIAMFISLIMIFSSNYLLFSINQKSFNFETWSENSISWYCMISSIMYGIIVFGFDLMDKNKN